MHSFEGAFNMVGHRRAGRFRRFEFRGVGGFAGRSVSRCFYLRLAALLLLMAFGGAWSAAGQDQLPPARIRDHIRNFHVANRRHVGGAVISSIPIVSKLYSANSYNPLWVDSENRDQLFQAVYAVKDDGLDPEDYHLSDLLRLRAEVWDSARPDTEVAGDFDLLLTDSFIRLAYHLSYGKVNPRSLNPAWNFGRDISDRDPVPVLLDAIRSSNVFDFLDRLKPQVPYYLKLRTALAVYRDIQHRGGWKPIPEDVQFVKGECHAQVDLLRERLSLTGDLTDPCDNPELFDDEMELGVVRFKIRNHLGIDPSIRRTTVIELNRPVEYWIDKIKVNLERARWVLHNLPSEFVVVDIAGFFVYVYRDHEIVWRSRIQVGGPARQTPSFRSKIDHLVLNPSWTVPPGVLDGLILPEACKNPSYVSQQGFTVLDARGKAVDPSKIDWAAYSAKTLPFRLRQGPGPTNPMGAVKFSFPNESLIFLHDTPDRDAFKDMQRAFSFGCVRVEKSLELAERLLNDSSKWTLERLLETTRTQKPQAIRLPHPMPIILVYMTVLVERDGTLFFREDVYERDKAVLRALNERNETVSHQGINEPGGCAHTITSRR